MASSAPQPSQEDVSAITLAVRGRPVTGVGAGLLAVEPLPSSPASPLPHAYTVPAE